MNRLQEIVEEDNGEFSTTRLAFLLWCLGVLAVWVVESLASHPMTVAKIDRTVTTILAGVFFGAYGAHRLTPLENQETTLISFQPRNQITTV